MAQRTDLYSILISYANKNNSPYIDIEAFLSFLHNYARRYADQNPEWKKWTTEVQVKFWSELSPLVDAKKCTLMHDNQEGKLFVVEFYTELITRSYESPDKDADIPFPDENALGLTIPQDMLRPLNIEYDLIPYLDNPQESDLPVLKLIFPDGLAPALTLSSLIPRALMQSVMLKIRGYLRGHNNREYTLRRLQPQLQGKESLLQEMFTRIDMRPMDCLYNIETGGEFASLFWQYFCNLVKIEVRKKNELLASDIATLQAVNILEIYVFYSKNKAAKEREKELAFKSLEQKLDKPPFSYTLDQIIKFKDNNGHDLLDQYSVEELEDFLKNRAIETAGQSLPELVIFRSASGEQLFVSKSKVFPLCARLLGEARTQVRRGITRRWAKILRSYDSEPAMHQEQDFEKLLQQQTKLMVPTLVAILSDRRLYLIQEELERTQGSLPEASRLYTKRGELLPYSSLLLVKRKDLLTDAKILLPFWYTIPIITAILTFFKRFKPKPPMEAGDSKAQDSEEITGTVSTKARDMALVTMAQQYEATVIPEGHTVETYLEELESQWKKIISKDAQKQLVTDVQTLIRDKLRQLIRIQGNRIITTEAIESAANAVINEVPTLKELDTPDNIRLYFTLYAMTLIKKIKF